MRSPSRPRSAGSRVVAAATALSTTMAVARPIEVRAPSPVKAREAIAMTTVPPAKTTAAPDEDIASARAVLLSRPALRFSR